MALEEERIPAERQSLNGSVKKALRRVLSNPDTARRALKLSDSQLRVAGRAHNFSARLDGVVTELAMTQAGVVTEAEEVERSMLLRYYDHLREHIATLPLQPTISVLVPVYRPKPRYLREALMSVSLQTYDNWEVCITDDASGDLAIADVIDEFANAHPGKVKIAVHEANQHISATSNTSLAMATGDYVALLDHDDRLYPHALAEVVRAVNTTASSAGQIPQVLYSDERVVGPEGEWIADPFFKPGWSPFLHLSVNYTTHLSVYQRELLTEIGGFREGFEGAQDHDLMLRAVAAADSDVVQIPIVLYQWRSHAESTASEGDAKPYAWTNGRKAIAEACAARGRQVDVTMDEFTGHYRLAFALPEPRPLVSVVIPHKNDTALLRNCVESILNRSTYPSIEVVIVDNGSTTESTWQYYEELRASPAQIQVVEDPEYFNFARLNNVGARAANGEYLILLNNDTEVRAPDWIEQMLMYAQFDEVGAVGAKLLYPHGSVQHGGIVGVASLIADHSGWHTRPEDHLYIDMIDTVHEAMAVTAAALMIRTSTYTEVGGLDEVHVPNGYGDVDLCLRLRHRGLASVYTPYAQLVHFESVTRRRNVEVAEMQYMRRTWGSDLLNDPYLNPNLNRSGQYTIDPVIIQPEISAGLFSVWLREGVAT